MSAHVLLVDNYDSFTYNLAHLFEELGAEVTVLRNDAVDAGSAVEKLEGAAEDLGEAAKQAGEAAVEAGQQAAESAGEAVQQAGEAAAETAGEMMDDADEPRAAPRARTEARRAHAARRSTARETA